MTEVKDKVWLVIDANPVDDEFGSLQIAGIYTSSMIATKSAMSFVGDGGVVLTSKQMMDIPSWERKFFHIYEVQVNQTLKGLCIPTLVVGIPQKPREPDPLPGELEAKIRSLEVENYKLRETLKLRGGLD